jgi:hypothetical protein
VQVQKVEEVTIGRSHIEDPPDLQLPQDPQHIPKDGQPTLPPMLRMGWVVIVLLEVLSHRLRGEARRYKQQATGGALPQAKEIPKNEPGQKH